MSHCMRIVFLVLTLFISGCFKVGPDFQRPETNISEDWLKENTEVLKQGDHLEWWKLFNDPVLEQLIETAYRQNLDLQIAGVRILEARAQLGIARGSLFPQKQQVGAGVSLDRASENSDLEFISSGISTYGTFQMGFDAMWEIDIWGRFRRGIESADAKLAMSVADYDSFLVSLTAEVAATYVQIRTFQQRLKLARENEQIERQSLHITEVRLKNGLNTELDVQQAKALLYATRALISSLEVGLRHSQNAMSILLGVPAYDLPEVLHEYASIPTAQKEITTGIPANMLRRRPDVRREELKAAAQSALIGVAKADLFPRFTLRGAIGVENSSTKAIDMFSIFNMKSLAATVGPTVSWPILNYGRLKNNIRVQDAKFQQLLIGYHNTVLRAVQEVEDAMVGFLKARERVQNLTEGVHASNRAVSLSLLQYRDGIEDYTRVLNSQQFLVQQQDKLTSSQGDVALNVIAMYKALGGGWEVRQGKELLPKSVINSMETRTDWGEFLEQPETVQVDHQVEETETQPPASEL